MKGILFNSSTGMLKAVIDGKKSMTRRLGGINKMNEHPERFVLIGDTRSMDLPFPAKKGEYSPLWFGFHLDNSNAQTWIIKPRYKLGETVYVKESHWKIADSQFVYRVDNNPDFAHVKWSNSMFCGEKEARYFIRITRIKVERLQDINVIDCEKEGIYPYEDSEDYPCYSYKDILNMDDWGVKTPMESFASLINKINGKDTWKNNLWCFVYEFEKVK